MYDTTIACTKLGFQTDAQTLLQFEISNLGYLVLDGPNLASIVLSQRSSDLNLVAATTHKWDLALPVLLSSTTGGLLCYHLLAPSDNDETDTLLSALDELIKQLATIQGV